MQPFNSGPAQVPPIPVPRTSGRRWALLALALFFLVSVAVLVVASAGSNGALTNASTSSIDVWAGRAEFARFSADIEVSGNISDYIWFGVNQCSAETGRPFYANASGYSLLNGSVGPNSSSYSPGLVLDALSSTFAQIDPGADVYPDLHLDVGIGADFGYAGAANGELTIIWKTPGRGGGTSPTICMPTGIAITVHTQVVFAEAPRLWSDRYGNYTEGSWISKDDKMHFLVSPELKYEGTDHLVEATIRMTSVIENPSNLSDEPSTAPYWQKAWDYGGLNESRGGEVHIRLRETGSPPWKPTVAHIWWSVLVDVDPPFAASVSPPPGTETLFGSPNASIGMLACDDDSGISLSPDAATIEEASGAVPGNITGHVDRRDEGSRCVEILFLLEPPVGSSNWTITLHDAVGNAGRIENILIRRLPVGIRFSQFTPDGPLPVLAINASVRAQAPVGAQVNLSSVEWSISDGPGDTRSWNSANLTGATTDALLTALLPLPYSEAFYLQWSATLVGSDERIHSPLFIVTGDVEAPFGGDLVCGPLVDRVSSVSVTLGDNTTLLNWDALHIVVTDGYDNAHDVSARLVEAVSTTAGNATFDVPIGWGVNRIDVVAHDAVGNPLAETFCQVTGPTPFNPTGHPRKGATTTWVEDWVLFMLAIVVAAAVFVYVALRVGHGRGDD